MSDRVRLACGCTARIESATRTRLIEIRHERCREKDHRPGGRVWLWELLVDPRQTAMLDEAAAWQSSGSLV
jgi:hypothetical protein